MADFRHSTPAPGANSTSHNRRLFLAVGMAAGVAMSVAAPAYAIVASPRAEWDAAMARYHAAKDAYDRHSRDVHDPASASGDMTREIAEENDRLGDDLSRCEDTAIAMPAPDPQALRWKLEYLLKDTGDGYVDAWSRDYMAQPLSDIARLLGGDQ